MISKSDRIQLRSLANNLPDLVYIGKDGLTDNVYKQICDNLFAHELIKIKIQTNCGTEIKELCPLIERKCECEVVSAIGRKVILYKISAKKDIKHII